MTETVAVAGVNQLSNSRIGFGKDVDEDALLNVVRQLRPVSFRYKKSSESKHSRYGFVAQELEALLPAVVRADPVSGLRYVSYTDVLAVLVLGAQQTEGQITKFNLDLSHLEERLAEDSVLLDPRISALERALVDIIAAGATVRPAPARSKYYMSENFAEVYDANVIFPTSNVVLNSTIQRSDASALFAELETLALRSSNHRT